MIIYPDVYLKSVQDITIQFLREKNIKALILDVDNTLIDYNSELKSETIKWAKELKMQGIIMYILSNTNKVEKVKMVADKLEVPYKLFAQKPFKKGFLEVKKEIEMESANIGVVGDQIFTDIIGGNRCKMFTILVDPIGKKDFWYTAWKRPIENKIKQKLKR